MVDEALVKENLTKEMIDGGRELTLRLKGSGFPVVASLWMYLPESNIWRLHIASPLVDTKGSLYSYRKIQSVLRESEDEFGGMMLSDVTVIEPSAKVIAALQRGPISDSLTEKRLKGSLIGGHYISDAYIYKLA